MAAANTDTVYLGKVYEAYSGVLSANELSLANEIEGMANANVSQQPTQAQLLAIQYKMQVFAFFAEFCSTFEKKISDAFQGIVRNF